MDTCAGLAVTATLKAELTNFVAPASRPLFVDIRHGAKKLPARCWRYKTFAEVLVLLHW